MTTEEALRYINSNDSKDEVKGTATDSLPEAEPEIESQEPDTAKVPEEDNKADDIQPESEVGSNEPEPQKVKTQVKDKEPDVENGKNSRISKRDYAFIRERSKHKAQIEERDKRIKELEEIVNKYKDLKPEHFKKKDSDEVDYEAYTNYRLDQRDWKDEIERRKREINDIQNREIELENNRRLDLSFPEEKDKFEYQRLLETKGQDFLASLEYYGLKDTVLGYLGRNERYPLVLKRLLTDDDAVRKVFRDHDPDVIKLRLAELTEDTLYSNSNEPANTQVKTQGNVNNKAIPIIGRQISTTPGSEPTVRDRAYWNNYILKTRGH